mmetsp:Transcript_2398/g.2873  ORF Transcript_2398/g.2873 Transcript_2398/m.2873 type:complete len:92 (-) Transcript_2398:315-590(-)
MIHDAVSLPADYAIKVKNIRYDCNIHMHKFAHRKSFRIHSSTLLVLPRVTRLIVLRGVPVPSIIKCLSSPTTSIISVLFEYLCRKRKKILI